MPDSPQAEAAGDAPRFEQLPTRIRRASRAGPVIEELSIDLVTTTPILGGGARTRELDKIDIIRAPTIRGHLRFWWRALYGHLYADRPEELFKAEAALWGRAGDENGGRSQVEVRVEVLRRTSEDRSEIHLNDPSSYALFSAKRQQDGTPVASRWEPGLRFKASLSWPCDMLIGREVIANTVRAWVLFGGYGSRTRRGVGSLQPVSNRGAGANWLPGGQADDFRSELNATFGRDVFEIGPGAYHFPVVAGASFLIGDARADAVAAWTEALRWLRQFRQGVNVARDPGTHAPQGRSRWPEADKLRHLYSRFGHPTRHNDQPAWPRAGFGLPIVGQFKDTGEPPRFELTWGENLRDEYRLQDRMATPLILKALPTRRGFVPCALWLNRSFPRGDVVVVEKVGDKRQAKAGSAAPFTRLMAPGDACLVSSLTGKTSLREAFLDWLVKAHGLQRVAG